MTIKIRKTNKIIINSIFCSSLNYPHFYFSNFLLIPFYQKINHKALCINYTKLVYIIHLKESYPPPNPLGDKDSLLSSFFSIYRILYMVELPSLLPSFNTKRVHKNCGVYALNKFRDDLPLF
jgi:hypothetical protein